MSPDTTPIYSAADVLAVREELTEKMQSLEERSRQYFDKYLAGKHEHDLADSHRCSAIASGLHMAIHALDRIERTTK